MRKKKTTIDEGVVNPVDAPLAKLEGRFFFVGSGPKTRMLDQSVAESVIQGIIQADFTNGHPIILVVSGPGGDVPATFAVADAISMCRSPTIALAIGEVCSGHAHVWMAAKTRYMSPTAQMMFHSPTGTERGTPEEMASTANLLAGARRVIIDRLKEESKLTETQIIEAMQTEKYWSAKECKKYGLSHGTVGSWAPIARHINIGA